jgi:cysteinyl-tRNA synthetase
LRNVIDTWGRETLLVYLLTGHWRKPIDFDDVVLARAAAQAEAFRNVFRSPSEPARPDAWERFSAALDDDFSTPEALAVMHELRDHDLLARTLEVFGLATLAESREAPAEVVALAEERQRARERQDFTEADRLRDEIAALGWEARDVADGFQLVPR